MGKKTKGGNPNDIIKAVKIKLQDGQFAAAAALFRRAKFPPQFKKRADQLNIDIHYFWALDAFEKKDYLQAITTLRQFTERFKKKINLPLEKANMLLGLSYFYINDLE
jgi:outer membrane protein assembly factor BamD (BamD/ComL family)